ncbi:hypothetical protein QBC39DRAFT_386519 [Podospora conica]|nr:hypothetical protein QBC39DRAFT_386519 [Schizothecium conicum]
MSDTLDSIPTTPIWSDTLHSVLTAAIRSRIVDVLLSFLLIGAIAWLGHYGLRRLRAESLWVRLIGGLFALWYGVVVMECLGDAYGQVCDVGRLWQLRSAPVSAVHMQHVTMQHPILDQIETVMAGIADMDLTTLRDINHIIIDDNDSEPNKTWPDELRSHLADVTSRACWIHQHIDPKDHRADVELYQRVVGDLVDICNHLQSSLAPSRNWHLPFDLVVEISEGTYFLLNLADNITMTAEDRGISCPSLSELSSQPFLRAISSYLGCTVHTTRTLADGFRADTRELRDSVGKYLDWAGGLMDTIPKIRTDLALFNALAGIILDEPDRRIKRWIRKAPVSRNSKLTAKDTLKMYEATTAEHMPRILSALDGSLAEAVDRINKTYQAYAGFVAGLDAVQATLDDMLLPPQARVPPFVVRKRAVVDSHLYTQFTHILAARDVLLDGHWAVNRTSHADVFFFPPPLDVAAFLERVGRQAYNKAKRRSSQFQFRESLEVPFPWPPEDKLGETTFRAHDPEHAARFDRDVAEALRSWMDKWSDKGSETKVDKWNWTTRVFRCWGRQGGKGGSGC